MVTRQELAERIKMVTNNTTGAETAWIGMYQSEATITSATDAIIAIADWLGSVGRFAAGEARLAAWGSCGIMVMVDIERK